MAYNSTGLVVHDADAHIMETPTWLRDHADPAIRDRIQPLDYAGGNELRQTGDPDEQLRDLDAAFERLRARHGSEEYRAVEADEIMMRKNFAATGARSSPRTVRAHSTCWASPANWCSTRSTTAGCTTGSTPATSTSRSAPRAPTTAG